MKRKLIRQHFSSTTLPMHASTTEGAEKRITMVIPLTKYKSFYTTYLNYFYTTAAINYSLGIKCLGYT